MDKEDHEDVLPDEAEAYETAELSPRCAQPPASDASVHRSFIVPEETRMKNSHGVELIVQICLSLCRLVLGFNAAHKNALALYKRESGLKVAFPAGRYLTFANVHFSSMSFIPPPQDVRDIECVAVCPSRRYIAVAELLEGDGDKCRLVVISLSTSKRVRVITPSSEDTLSDLSHVLQLEFSCDSKALTAVMQGGDSKVVLHIDWYNRKVLAALRSGSYLSSNNANGLVKVLQHPSLAHTVFAHVSPSSVWCLTHHTNRVDESKKTLPLKRDDFYDGTMQHLVDVCFTSSSRMILLWYDASMTILEHRGSKTSSSQSESIADGWTEIAQLASPLLARFSKSVDDISEEGGASIGDGTALSEAIALAIRPSLRGFYVALAHEIDGFEEVISYEAPMQAEVQGSVAELSKLMSRPIQRDEENERNEPYVVSKRIVCNENYSFSYMVSPIDGQALLIATQEGDMLERTSTGLASQDVLTPVAGGFAKGAITAMDMCEVKPLVAACDENATLRVWDWNDFSLWASLVLMRPATTVALHPSGTYILVGEEKLRLRILAYDEITTLEEFQVPYCEEARFSSGGHLFAVASRSGVQLYDTYSRSLSATLRGHSGVVNSICWGPKDMTIATGCNGGTFYVWSAPFFSRDRKRDCMSKNCSFECIASCYRSGEFLVSGNDGYDVFHMQSYITSSF